MMGRRRIVQLVAVLIVALAEFNYGQISGSDSKLGSSQQATIQFVDKHFGFRFTLPADWKGYTIVQQEWRGDRDMADVKGPTIFIRHPRWIEQDPWQDIPIMIFTHQQWKWVRQGRLTVSASPTDPSELGHNRTYVFALPPRFYLDEQKANAIRLGALMEDLPTMPIRF